MRNERLVHNSEVKIDGESYSISVYCRPDGRHYAKTFLNDHDIIINDGSTLSEVLVVHESLLPLAVSAHRSRESLRRTLIASRSPRLPEYDAN